ncbi:specific RNA polymerase II transcription factor [Verticillium dahliae VdLs.17]|uniref:Specific RNA polymerase II transcription factor n=1 Tax=Verticillium dahliae (strain VdLs.17 / ATCC MYA-4575 / FGSC 10137) TaxID=498257 RepID=G2WVY7_VERDV|nr:specific RNA polymerase II transcription factor [Verticillium dahliae VdLs.17]EGY19757.1 specific RNA polymerase II transcription factor [Verticillium dahliae VdLs.17]
MAPHSSRQDQTPRWQGDLPGEAQLRTSPAAASRYGPPYDSRNILTRTPTGGGADVLSPGSSTSGANSGSSQHSALSGLSSHYSAHGSWPTPSAPAYTLSSVSPTPNTLTHAHTHPYDHKASSYDPGSSMYNTTARAPHDPSPTYGHAHSSHANGHSQHQFPGSLFGHGGAASGSLPSHGHAHGHTAAGRRHPESPVDGLDATSNALERRVSRRSIYTAPFDSKLLLVGVHAASAILRLGTSSTFLLSLFVQCALAHHYGMQVPSMGGPIMSNLSNPSGPLSVMPGMNLPGYGGHHLQHIYGAHQNNPQERPFKCDQCPQSFNRNHDLKRHKRIHLAVKPFPCDHCDKSFSRKDALKRHRLVKGCGGEKTNGTETTRSPGGGSDGSESPLAPSIKKDDE